MQAGFDLFDLAPDPAALFAADGKRLRANAAFARAFPHAMTGPRPPWGRVQPPDFVGDERCFEAGAPDGRRYEWRERRLPDGSRIAMARDVTSRVEAAEEVARAKTVLFATLTHELRTPLNGVMGMAEILSQTVRGQAEREYLRAIRTSGEHLLTLITDILDYARIESESFAPEEKVFDPREMAQAIAELMSPRAFEKGVDVSVRISVKTPRKVAGDERRLRQILFNLAGNAVKFTSSGGVLIEVAPRGPANLRFIVRDTGPGVPAEMQGRIFDEFVQVDSGHARGFGGAGLGLAIVRKLARGLGGDVGVESADGNGASFWVDMPVTVVEPAQGGEHWFAGVHVLIAAPRQFLGEATANVIRQAGGAASFDPSAPCDVALIDQSELSIAQSLPANLPKIVLVPQEDRAALEDLRQRGFSHYLVKPLRRNSLVARILVALGRAAPTTQEDDADTNAPLASQAGRRVLVAEDNPVNALIIRTMLERAGCSVTMAENGEAAVEAARVGAFDLVFLDLRMPVLDGTGAARRIRSLPGPISRAPLIALTADAGESERAAAFTAGMDDFITKPIEPKRLADILARFTRAPNEAKLAAS
jgi:signal transduction histidine kinase/CheY-like chemotaxis protein